MLRLKSGSKLARDELEYVQQRLADASGDDPDLYNLVRILGLGAPASFENVQLVDRFLSLCTEEWGLHGVIFALCLDWGLAEDYVDTLREMSALAVYESHQSAAIAALAALGNYLMRQTDRETIGVLLANIDSALSSSACGDSASLREYRNTVWHALDEWARGREAQVQPTDFELGSKAYTDVVRRFATLTHQGVEAANAIAQKDGC